MGTGNPVDSGTALSIWSPSEARAAAVQGLQIGGARSKKKQ